MMTEPELNSAANPSLELLAPKAQELRLGADQPLPLETPGHIWLVKKGGADIFAVHKGEQAGQGRRLHLCEVTEQGLFMGLTTPPQSECSLLAVPSAGSVILQVEAADFWNAASGAQTAARASHMIEDWLNGLWQGVNAPLAAKSAKVLAAEGRVKLEPGEAVISQDFLWAGPLDGCSLAGKADLAAPAPVLPLPHGSWLECASSVELSAISTEQFLARSPDSAPMEKFTGAMLILAGLRFEQQRQFELGRLQERIGSARRASQRAVSKLAAVLHPETETQLMVEQGGPALLTACRLVARHQGGKITLPAPGWEALAPDEQLQAFAHSSGLRIRPVALKDEWHKHDCGALLTFDSQDGRPQAIIPKGSSSYSLHDPAKRSTKDLGPEDVEQMRDWAYSFHLALPERALGAWDMIRFGVRNCSADLWTILGMGIVGGIMGLIPPVATGYMFNSIIPGAELGQLWQMTIILIVIALASAAFQLTRTMATLRVEGKMDGQVEAGLWNRLLELPAPFFRQYTAGDMAMRANAINAIRQTLSGAVVTTMISGIFSLFSLALLFYYSWRLGLVTLLILLVMALVTWFLGWMSAKHLRALLLLRGKINGLVFQLISGVDKLHLAGATGRAFATWAESYAEQRRVAYSARCYENWLVAFNATLPVLGLGVLFYYVVYYGKTEFNTGDFMAFVSAFTSLLASLVSMTRQIMSSVIVVPMFDQVRPLISTPVEVDRNKTHPGALRGHLEASEVSFRYDQSGPLILHKLNFSVQPEEFVALVGSSGSGKSTIMRLLLGFEKPTSGSIFYDGQDLAELDLQSLRRQIGVVLQDGNLIPGEILANIVGSRNLSEDDAWEAARLVGLEEDLKAMPMGMHTVISENAGTISGGQKQRILIARAIVTRPSILFLDEATSALDNRTQSIVTRSMERLNVTRIVIAHRLSTIRNADRILVLDGGRVAENGNFEQLMEQKGLFYELARRQMA